MKKAIFALLIFTSMPAMAHADGWNCDDPDVVFCMDLNEQSGTVAIERSRSGYSGTYNGGPAHTIQQPKYLNRFSTTTFAMFQPLYANFTRTVGEDVTCALDTRFDEAGKPFMAAMVFSMDSNVTGSRSLWNYATGDVSLGGWDWRIDGAGDLNFGVIGLADYTFVKKVFDFNPHAVCAWVSGTGTIVLYFDGAVDSRIVGSQLITSVVGQIAVARRVAAGHAEFGGGINKLRIKKNVTSEYQATALAERYFNDTFGRGQ